MFGNDKKGGTTVAPKPPGVSPPDGPSEPKKPELELPGQETHEDEAPRRKKLSDASGSAGKKAATGGGGGGGSNGGGGVPPGGGFGGMTPNQLLLAVVR